MNLQRSFINLPSFIDQKMSPIHIPVSYYYKLYIYINIL